MRTIRTEYAMYRGDRFVDIGTMQELAVKWGVKKSALYFASSPAAHKRHEGRKISKNSLIVIKLEDEDDD